MGTTLTRVCSGTSSWHCNHSAPLPYPEMGFACVCYSCIMFHVSIWIWLSDMKYGQQAHKKPAELHQNPVILQKEAPNCKVLTNQNKMKAGGLHEGENEVIFIPGVRGRETLVLWWSCFIYLLACLRCEEDDLYSDRAVHIPLAPSLSSGKGLGWPFMHPAIFSMVQSSSSLSVFLRWYLRVLSNGAVTISLWCPLQTLPVIHLPSQISWWPCTCAAHLCFPFFAYPTCLRDGNWH